MKKFTFSLCNEQRVCIDCRNHSDCGNFRICDNFICRGESCDDFDNETDCSNSPGCIKKKFIIIYIGYYKYPYCLKIKVKSESCDSLEEIRCIKEFGCILY